MSKVKLTLATTEKTIANKDKEFEIDLPEGANLDDATNWLMYWLSTELKVENIWQGYLNKLPDPQSVEVSEINVRTTLSSLPAAYYNDMNAAKAWLETYNQLLAARTHLARARAYKAIEQEYSNNEMHVLHERKMAEFHHAVRNIKKIEDMMIRLIFEALGASLKNIKKLPKPTFLSALISKVLRFLKIKSDLGTALSYEVVDTSKDEWERNLSLDKVKPALKQREINDQLKNMDDAEYTELRNIVGAMNHGANKKLWDFWQYRHKLEHRMPQSVDYVYLYPSFEDRPQPLIQGGKQVGMLGFIGSMPINTDWVFTDLYETTVVAYEHYLNLLERLDKLPTFRRPK
jgi:hypothetical protein